MILLTKIISFIDGHLRPIECGEELIKAEYFVKYGVLSMSNTGVQISGLCLQSSHIHEKPHKIDITISASSAIEKSFCTCKAGQTGKCKHCVGLMILLSRSSVESLPKWSVTDQPCSWAAQNKNRVDEMVAPKPLKEFCHFPVLRMKTSRSIHFNENEALRILLDGFPTSALVKHLAGRNTNVEPPAIDYDAKIEGEIRKIMLSECHSLLRDTNKDLFSLSACAQDTINFYEDFVSTTLEEAKKIYVHTMKQNSVTWKKFRQICITGYKVYSLYTYFMNKKPDWAKKCELTYFSLFSGNRATKYGKRNEPKALKTYASQCEGEVITDAGLLVRHQVPWLGYSADGFHRMKDDKLALLEVKCPVIGKTVETLAQFVSGLAFLEQPLTETHRELKQKHPYYGQIQLGLMLHNLQLGELLLFWKKKKTVIEVLVLFNETFVQEFVYRLRIVYFERILPYLHKNRERCFIHKFGADSPLNIFVSVESGSICVATATPTI